LADLAISPFLSKLFSKGGAGIPGQISFVDLGSGNGALASNIWRQMLKTSRHITQSCKLACSMVGLRLQDPLRHFNKSSAQGTVSNLAYSQADYLLWLHQQAPPESNCRFDVALICRLLNNLSAFRIDSSTNWRVIHKLGDEHLGEAAWINREFEPHNCLSRDNFSTENIFLKNSNVSMRGGKSYRHLSLSNYYKGLQLLSAGNASTDDPANVVYFPIRQFNPASLELPDGKSALEKLCNLARLVVIEDVDLTKRDLINHLIEHNLDNIAFSHIRRHNRVNSAQIFCLCNTEFQDLLPGTKTWPNSLLKIENQMYSRLLSSAAFQRSQRSI
jgi:hypothetical protein